MRESSYIVVLKTGYVTFAQLVASAADHLGVCKFLKARENSRWAHWVQSLGAIHDIDQMIRLNVPWWTYNSIDQVEQFLKDRANARVLEYGSGASTVWLADRAGSVVSVEHDKDWHSVVAKKTEHMANVELLLREANPLQEGAKSSSQKVGNWRLDFTEYVHAINDFPGPYDLIVIDGRARSACLLSAVGHLELDGLIVFDNSNRRRYQTAIHSCGGRVRRYSGLTPCLPYFDETSLITFPVGRN